MGRIRSESGADVPRLGIPEIGRIGQRFLRAFYAPESKRIRFPLFRN